MTNDDIVGESMWKMFAQAVDELEADEEERLRKEHNPSPKSQPFSLPKLATPTQTTKEKALPPLKIKQTTTKSTGKRNVQSLCQSNCFRK